MNLKTRAILIHNITGGDAAKSDAIESALNETLVVWNCANCVHGRWDEPKLTVHCDAMCTTPPLWAVAMGCSKFDYIPF